MMLEIRDLECGYGKLAVLRGLNLAVNRAEPTAVLGANGAGKTTLCRVLSGLLQTWKGTISFDGLEISKMTPTERVIAGIAQVPEGRQVFPRMTVDENLRLGGFVHGEPFKEEYENVFGMFPILFTRRSKHAGLLSGGEQQMLALARCLMSRPKLLLLDEPSQGLAPKAVELVGLAVQKIAAAGVGVLLVEQNLMLAEMVAKKAIILEMGRSIRDGDAAEIFASGEVESSYLGRTH